MRTICITFHVTDGEVSYDRSYELSVCDSFDLDPSNAPAIAELMRSLLSMHHDELLHAQPFICMYCSQQAVSFVMSGLASAEQQQLKSFCMTVCGRQKCRSKLTHVLADSTAAAGMPHHFTGKAVSEQGKEGACGSCGQVNHTQLCGRCMTVPYCSIACQRRDWPWHKLQCKSPSPSITPEGI